MVASVAALGSEPTGPEVNSVFAWDDMPKLDVVVSQLKQVPRWNRIIIQNQP